MRQFKTGANRNSDRNKLDYNGFLDPRVELSFAKYMHHHRKLDDGTLRDSDNKKKGIPNEQLLKSLHRHFIDVWLLMSDVEVTEDGAKVNLEYALNGMKFNINALLYDLLKGRTEAERNGE